MRTRPTLEMFYGAHTPRPGDTVDLEAVVTAKSETLIDVLRVHLTGYETRGRTRARVDDEVGGHPHLNLVHEWGPLRLTQGERRALPFSADLPRSLPPTWRSDASLIEYRVQLSAKIPGWFNAEATFRLPVGPARQTPAERGPRVFSSMPTGPLGTELALEIALDSVAIEVGGVVRGAVALLNAEHHRIRRLEVSLVAIDAPARPGLRAALEALRTPPLVLAPEQAPAGTPLPFLFQLPKTMTPSFDSQLSSVTWHVEARAVVRGGVDLIELAPLEVYATGEASPRVRTSAPRLAAVGQERRAQAWSAVAERAGLSVDTREETMSGVFGNVHLEVGLELRGGRRHLVAWASWLPLDLRVTVSERSKRARGTRPSSPFDERFVVGGRDPAQLEALFNTRVRAALLGFERVSLDDTGAELSSAGSGYDAEELEAFVQRAVQAAVALSVSIADVPPHPALAAARLAWAAFALKHDGRFGVGGFAIRKATYRGATVELVTRYDDGGAPVATVARVLHSGLWGSDAPQISTKSLSAEAQRVFASLERECQALTLSAEAVEACLPCPLPDPTRAETTWRALQRLVQAISGPDSKSALARVPPP